MGVGKPIVYIFKGWGHLPKEFWNYENEAIVFWDYISQSSNTGWKRVRKHVHINQWNILNFQQLDIKKIFDHRTFFGNISDL